MLLAKIQNKIAKLGRNENDFVFVLMQMKDAKASVGKIIAIPGAFHSMAQHMSLISQSTICKLSKTTNVSVLSWLSISRQNYLVAFKVSASKR